MVTTEELLAKVIERVGPIQDVNVGIDPEFIERFPTPLDLAIADKKAYGKPNHLLQVEFALLDAWNNKESTAISLPARWGKSETVGYFISWLISQFPELRIMFASYNQKLSTRFVRNVKRILERFSPSILDPEKQTHEYFETLAGGFLLATSPDSTAAGYGASIIVIDDLIKTVAESLSGTVQENHRDWWDGTASTRLEPFALHNNWDIYYNPFVVAIGTLYSTRDLLNVFHEEFKSLMIPALNDAGESNWPERWTTDALLEKKRVMASSLWKAMYECSPVVKGGNLFKESWLREEKYPLLPGPYKATGLFVDPAVSTKSGADSTAVCLARFLADNRLFVEKLWVYKKSVFNNIKFLASLYETHSPNRFIVENVGFADALVEGLQKKGIPVVGWTPGQRDKVTRIVSQLEAPLESGLMCFSDSVLENEVFRGEYVAFPEGTHDDTLDVLAITAEEFFSREEKRDIFLLCA